MNGYSNTDDDCHSREECIDEEPWVHNDPISAEPCGRDHQKIFRCKECGREYALIFRLDSIYDEQENEHIYEF